MSETDDWNQVCAGLLTHKDVERGTMMRRPALRYRGTVFAFLTKLHGPGLAAKTESADLEALGVTNAKVLQPFKKKAPMRGWYVVPPSDKAAWLNVTQAALAVQEAHHA